jgi:serine/threonine protein kinase
MAPEIVELMLQRGCYNSGYSYMVDWWSMGVTIFNLLTGRMPFESYKNRPLQRLTPEDHYKALMTPVQYPDTLSPSAVDLIKRFLEVDESKRLGLGVNGLKDIQDHAFFSKTNWKSISSRKAQPPYVPSMHVDYDAVYGTHLHFKNFHELVSLCLTGDETVSEIEDSEQQYFQHWYDKSLSVSCICTNDMLQGSHFTHDVAH